MQNDLSDIARGRRISAVTARELDLIARHTRPKRHSQDSPARRWSLHKALRTLFSRLARWIT